MHSCDICKVEGKGPLLPLATVWVCGLRQWERGRAAEWWLSQQHFLLSGGWQTGLLALSCSTEGALTVRGGPFSLCTPQPCQLFESTNSLCVGNTYVVPALLSEPCLIQTGM